MALIKCPECENEISTLSTACPKCGYPILNDEIKKEQEVKEKEQEIIDSFNEQVEENFIFRETYKQNRRCLITRIIVFVISLILLKSNFFAPTKYSISLALKSLLYILSKTAAKSCFPCFFDKKSITI